MSKKEKIFANGFSFKRRENAPDFVVGNISIKVDDAVKFLNDNARNGWVNLNINTAQSGSTYIELDKFVPKTNNNTSTNQEVTEPDLALDF